MKSDKRLIVLAATRTDVGLGLKLFQALNIPMTPCYLSENPYEQTLLQIESAKLFSKVEEKLDPLLFQDVRCIAIYCNSLSGALGSAFIKKLEQRYQIPLVTPLEVYANRAAQSNRWSVWTANGQSLSHIERKLLTHNPTCTVMGFCSLKLVEAVEKGWSAHRIIETYGLIELVDVFVRQACQTLLVGCTHFVHFIQELQNQLQKKELALDFLEPSSDMFQRVSSILSLSAAQRRHPH